MKKRTLAAIIILTLLISLISSCKKPEPLLAPLTLGEINGERLWERLTKESNFREYSQWADHEGRRPGQSPHGVEHQVFANRTLFEALPVSTAPEGSIIVKENYNALGDMVKITAMVKVKNYDPDNNDWFWAAYNPDGTIGAEGKVEGCISCHEGLSSNDFVIIQPLNETP